MCVHSKSGELEKLNLASVAVPIFRPRNYESLIANSCDIQTFLTGGCRTWTCLAAEICEFLLPVKESRPLQVGATAQGRDKWSLMDCNRYGACTHNPEHDKCDVTIFLFLLALSVSLTVRPPAPCLRIVGPGQVYPLSMQGFAKDSGSSSRNGDKLYKRDAVPPVMYTFRQIMGPLKCR